MTELRAKLRAEIEKLLNEQSIDVFIAFKHADSPLRPQPGFFRPRLP